VTLKSGLALPYDRQQREDGHAIAAPTNLATNSCKVVFQAVPGHAAGQQRGKVGGPPVRNALARPPMYVTQQQITDARFETLAACHDIHIEAKDLPVPISILMATATYLAAPTAVDTRFRRRVTLRSVASWLGSTAVVFDGYHLARTGAWRYTWTLGNMAGNTVLYLSAGLVWRCLDLRQPRLLLPAGGATAVALIALARWSWS
jgi:hypothetical protein